MLRRVLPLLVTLTCGPACDSDSPTTPTGPEPGPASASPTVSGTVYETTQEGRRPLPGVRLLVAVQNRGATNGTSTSSDAEGRYEIPAPIVAEGGTARVYAFGGFLRHQPCVAQTLVSGATALDVEYNPRHLPGTGGSPTVSGRVFKVTSAGRQPESGREVLYYVRNALAAQTFTNVDGRYEFCKVPTGAGKVWVSDPLDYDAGGPAAEQSLNIAGDVVVDLEIIG